MKKVKMAISHSIIDMVDIQYKVYKIVLSPINGILHYRVCIWNDNIIRIKIISNNIITSKKISQIYIIIITIIKGRNYIDNVSQVSLKYNIQYLLMQFLNNNLQWSATIFVFLVFG